MVISPTATARLLDDLPDRPFLAAEAVRRGAPRWALNQLLASRLLTRPVRGVLVKSDQPDDVRLRAAAICLVLPAGAAVCRGTAAWLMGIDARPPGAHREDPLLECAVPVGITPSRRHGIRCYATDLVDSDLVEIGGVACVSTARTAIDLARWSIPGVGLGVLDAMARAELIQPADLLAMTERWQGDRFIAQARRLIALCDPRAESAGESWLRLRFHDAGFPAPDLQIPLPDGNGVERRRLDLGYRSHRHAWEYDGEEHHRGERAERADRFRRNEIHRRWGWTVVGVGKNLVLGPSMSLELAIGEVIGMQPAIRRRAW